MVKRVQIECLKCGHIDSGNNTFLDRKELRSKIKERMILCPECSNKKKFKYWEIKNA